MAGTEEQSAPQRVQPAGKRGGIWVAFGDEEYRVPPLGFRQIQELAAEVETLGAIGAQPTLQQMQVVARVVQAALSRNYPDITVDQVNDMLDIGNMEPVLSAVLGMSGFQAVPAGAAAQGEALASIGTASTAA